MMKKQDINEGGSLCRDLFKKLFNNAKDGDNEMWQPFNKDKFKIEAGFIEKISDEIQKEYITNLLNCESEEQISMLLNDSLFED